MASTKEIITKAKTFGSHNYAPFDLVLVRGEGSRVWDPEGREYLDLLGGYSALNHGHRHPKIIAAAHAQLDQISVVARCFLNEPLAEMAETLVKLSGLDRVMPMNSGAEAVESAIKVVRAWGVRKKGLAPHRAQIITCDNNFHGRTTTVVSFSSEPQYREQFGPLTPGFVHIPFGDAAALERAITDDTVAFLGEPIQGEGGIVVPPDGWMAQVREICTRRNIALIWDEVQTGLGRTGKVFCWQHENAQPDVLTLGKALGGGIMPVSACVGKREFMDAIHPGEHGSTFGGSPLAMTIGKAALDVLVDEKLSERAAELGPKAMQRIRDAKIPGILEVRGRGMLIGIELDPALGGAHKLCEMLIENGVLTKETRKHVLRLAPPLVISEAELMKGVDITLATIRQMAAQAQQPHASL
ncbi:MAG: ornithine--oxo-acid transaminase [Deltaproteobacteria bacterium]|nr:ornithine--oxo-acid transaminase [Deltaproteobacteria bacterium]